MLQCNNATMLCRCYNAIIQQCYNATIIQCLQFWWYKCYNARSMLQFELQCYNTICYPIQCYNATMLQCYFECYNATMLQFQRQFWDTIIQF